MKTNFFEKFLLAGIMPMFVGAGLSASPLTWFPGPPLGEARSGAATTVFSGGNNLLIGGDSYGAQDFLVEELAATNSNWTYPQSYFFYNSTLAPGAVAAGGMVIYYGGNDSVSSTSAAIGYSPSDGSQILVPMSVARSQLGYAADRNGNAYAFGGLDDTGQPLSSAEVYSQDTTNWSAVASLPTPLYDFPAVFNHTNYIYIFGGLTNPVSGTEVAAVFRYSVSGNSWTLLASMPVAVAGSAAALGDDGKIYVVGGTCGGVSTNVVQVYNPAANSWAISTPLPEGLSAAAMGVDSLGRLIVMGGMDTNGNDVSDVWRSQQLGVPDSMPAFTRYPTTTNGGYQLPYTSSISATGNPQPTYLVLGGPPALQVDPYSGVITWTPQAGDIGTNLVTIRATNYVGFADYTYVITVAPPPPSIPTNLTLVNLAENSVTFSWSPENPLVGPVTYSVYERHVVITKVGGYAYYTLVSSGNTNPVVTLVGLATGSHHSYQVVAVAAGASSGMSQIFSITTLTPQPPVNLHMTGLTSTTITLAWDPPPGPVPAASYEIWGWINGGVTVANDITGITNTTVTVTGLAPGSLHEWGVRDHDAGGYASGFDYGPTVVNPMPVPAALTAMVAPSGGGGFQFTVQANAAQTILIQATTNPGDSTSWTTIATNPPAGSSFIFTDTAASQFPIRFYRVESP